MTHFVFDIDGTLTPSRQKMTSAMQKLFKDFARDNTVYLVTGSNIEKTMEQVPMDILMHCREVYCESGSDVYHYDSSFDDELRGRESNYEKHWDCPVELRNALMNILNDSNFPTTMRTGNHIEIRKSMVNFSVIGRNATPGERYVYTLWDKDKNERAKFAELIEDIFPDLTANVAGEIGIDISPKGRDKSQILPEIKQWPDGNEPIVFFGDKTQKGGNDYPFAKAIQAMGENELNHVYHVPDWKRTYEILNDIWLKPSQFSNLYFDKTENQDEPDVDWSQEWEDAGEVYE